ncbi:beta-1,3-glucan-binding protein 2-like [Pseudomyrmex gracilis]|uniref:beta-1,3-glucan-binding protein 2-like n=1 Tax=Pseudomyrmex gracilis TaxID=219809 RepID=UPI00099549C1|nr:beta-1,3-glucan-binding protein 2-like [Pseudomyrmex gracilis]
MKKGFLFIISVLFAIILVNSRECRANYVFPPVKVEPLYPVGLRMSIPDEHGITLVAFHVKFNEDFDGLEAGSIAKDILKLRDGRWVYEDKQTQLRRDDILYYWIHVVYNGLGYNLVDQSHRVVDFYNYDGSVHIKSGIAPVEEQCTTKSTTWIFKSGSRQQACPGQLLFEEDFDTLNNTSWNLVQRFSGPPDDEFVVYMTNDVTDVSDGKLRIKPMLLDNKFGDNFASHGSLNLEGCTGAGTKECQRRGGGFYVLPPIISGRIDTKEKFEFLFGRVEVRAKLPHGDWVYPVIILESTENDWEFGIHHEIRIASSVGNRELTTTDNQNFNENILCAGGLTVRLNDSNAINMNCRALPKRRSSNPWSENLHIFELEWKNGLISVKVDGVKYGEQSVDASFGKRSYLVLGVAVGGIHEFADLVTSSGYVKPWGNVEAKALYKFNRAKGDWYPTWNAKTVLEVDYVKVWAL